MRIVSWNVNGLYNTLKDASVRHSSASHYFSEVLKADIVCFQEAKIQEEKLEKWMACVPGYDSVWAFSRAKKGYSGVVTYVKEELSPLDAKANCLGDFDDPLIEELCSEGRLIETDHGSFILINVYAPNAGDEEQGRPRLGFKLSFLKALKRKCDELVCSGRHVIIVGDLNVPHKDKDVHKIWNIRDIYSSEEIAFMDALLGEYVDLFRHFHPDDEDVFSVWNQKKEARIHNEGLRIDYAVCDQGFLSQVLCTDIVKMFPKSWSDHAAVVTTLKEQPMLLAHPRPALSSHNMKKFKEDHRQKRLTTLFSSSIAKGVREVEHSSVNDGQGDMSCVQEPEQTVDVSQKRKESSESLAVKKNPASKRQKTDPKLAAFNVNTPRSQSKQRSLTSYFH